MEELLKAVQEGAFFQEVNNLSYKLLNKPFANISYKDDIMGKDGLEELIKKVNNVWSNLGFTHGLDDEKATELSFAYTFLSEYLAKKEDEFNEKDQVIMFPIARRVVTGLEQGEFDIKQYIKLYKEQFNIDYLVARLKRRVRFWKNASTIDYEAEVGLIIAESMIEMFKEGSYDDVVLVKMRNYDKVVATLEAEKNNV